MDHSPAIHVKGIGKRFRSFVALQGVDLEIRAGELLALLGPSGSGKTTLLRIIAGLEWPDEGELLLNGDSALRRGVRERHIGFVFQHYALFRHMSVTENVAFGLRVMARQRRPSDAEIRSRVQRLLDLVQIGHLGDRFPSQLSGGERQRVALARALAIEPSVLLLDEQHRGLDGKVRKELRRWLRQLHDRLNMTTVFVTHDQEEALELADRVVVLGHGKIEQVGTPEEVYGAPRNPFVFDFLGQVNRVRCQVRGGRPIVPYAHVEQLNGDASHDGPGTLYVRPHDVVLQRDPAGPAIVRFVGVVGPVVRLEIEVVVGAPVVEAEMPHHVYAGYRFTAGDRVSVRFRAATLFSDVPVEPQVTPADLSLQSADL